MKEQQTINYERMKKAIIFITKSLKHQPDLAEIASHIGVSPFHFQSLVKDWAGVSSEKFIQYLSVAYAKSSLSNEQVTLFDPLDRRGLYGVGKLHDSFVTIEEMTAKEFKNGGEGLLINYSFAGTHFGRVLAASTTKGLCRLTFTDDETSALNELKSNFPKANFKMCKDEFQQNSLTILNWDLRNLNKVKLHLKGTDFQLKVWRRLLKIPFSKLDSYGKIASSVDKPGASRAVGNAVGDNPIAFLIPCHRVVQVSGTYGHYRWGKARKQLLIAWEAAQTEVENEAKINLA